MTHPVDNPVDNCSRVKKGLENPWIKGRLIFDLAVDEQTQQALANKYEVTRSAISQFKFRNKDLVEKQRAKMLDEYSDIWVADQRSRLLLRQTIIENMGIDSNSPKTNLAINKILDAVAAELGVYAPKNQVNVTVAAYELANVDINDI